MSALPPVELNHLNLPARDPGALGDWYVEKLGFERHGRFLWSGGTLLVFEAGEPLATERVHFGFRLPSLGALVEWTESLRARGVEVPPIEGDERYSTVFLRDPEGNKFEVFWEPEPAGGASDR